MRKRVLIVFAVVVVAFLSLSLGATHIEDASKVDFGVWLFYSAQTFVQIAVTLLILYFVVRGLLGLSLSLGLGVWRRVKLR